MYTISKKDLKKAPYAQLVNIPFDLKKVSKVKLDTNRPIDPSLWIIYLYAITKDKHERVARIWIFESEEAQFEEFQRIVKCMSSSFLVSAA